MATIDQGKSWMNLGTSQAGATGDRVVGQIFFRTDERSLDAEDKAVMEALSVNAKSYLASTFGPYLGPFTIGFLGWADHRGAAAYNLTLSQDRADRVKNYLDHYFTGPGGTTYWRGRYNSVAQGLGEGKLRGNDLSEDRRVDITTGLPLKQRVEFPDQPVSVKHPNPTASRQFEIRVQFGVSGGFFGAGGQALWIEIRNPRTGKTLPLRFLGGGGQIPVPKIPIGFNRPTAYQAFSVPRYLQLEDFVGEGYVFGSSVVAESWTEFGFFGPVDRGKLGEEASMFRRPVIVKTSGWDLNLGGGSSKGYWARRGG